MLKVEFSISVVQRIFFSIITWINLMACAVPEGFGIPEIHWRHLAKEQGTSRLGL